MGRTLVLVYGLVCYACFQAAFLYLIAFVGDLPVPKTVSSGESGPLATALLVDVALLGLFGVQHSGMARPGFKRLWTRIVPVSMERSTYVLATSAVLFLLYWAWRPLPGTLWSVEAPLLRGAIWALFFAGFGIVFLTTCLISHTHLFGLRQSWERFRGLPHVDPDFQTPSLYRLVRHPMMVGFLLAFWAAPEMSTARLLFAAGGTVYILVALQIEERDLVAEIGAPYRRYRERVPMLVPGLARRGRAEDPSAGPTGP